MRRSCCRKWFLLRATLRRCYKVNLWDASEAVRYDSKSYVRHDNFKTFLRCLERNWINIASCDGLYFICSELRCVYAKRC